MATSVGLVLLLPLETRQPIGPVSPSGDLPLETRQPKKARFGDFFYLTRPGSPKGPVSAK